jgi:carbon-monoxide dehydrogenase catalytic subunit
VASGIYTVLGTAPPIFGSPNIVKLLTEGLEDVFGATFAVEPDPDRAAALIRRHIERKRAGLGIPALDPESIPFPDTQLALV